MYNTQYKYTRYKYIHTYTYNAIKIDFVTLYNLAFYAIYCKYVARYSDGSGFCAVSNCTRNISAKMELLNGGEPIKIEGCTSKLLNGSPNFVHFVGAEFNLRY